MELSGSYRIADAGVNERGSKMRAATMVDVDAGCCAVSCEDEGPFFDLEFDLPAEEEERGHRENRRFSCDARIAYDERELQPTASFQRIERRDRILSLSSSDPLFLEGQLVVPLPPSSLPHSYQSPPASNPKPQVLALLHKSAAKFRVFVLGFHKKPKHASVDLNMKASSAPMAASTPRLYVEDDFPGRGNKSFYKHVLQKYLSKIKPFYVKVSERHGEKIRFSGPLTSGGAVKVLGATEGAEFSSGDKDAPPATASIAAANTKEKSQFDGTIPAGIRVVCRHLKKSRSTSGATTALSRLPSSASGRRDDTLLEQQNGIQSAIAHCKRSFNIGTESTLPRSRSDPGEESVSFASAEKKKKDSTKSSS